MTPYFRRPDWRHQECCELLKRRRSNPGIALNALLRTYLLYLRWLKYQHKLPDSKFEKTPLTDGVRFVHRLHSDDRCRVLRDELEMRILAGQTAAEIARTGL